MFKSRIIIIACSENADHNTVSEIADAVQECNACEIDVANNGVIHATVPTHEIGLIELMVGVCYVRREMTYAASN